MCPLGAPCRRKYARIWGGWRATEGPKASSEFADRVEPLKKAALHLAQPIPHLMRTKLYLPAVARGRGVGCGFWHGTPARQATAWWCLEGRWVPSRGGVPGAPGTLRRRFPTSRLLCVSALVVWVRCGMREARPWKLPSAARTPHLASTAGRPLSSAPPPHARPPAHRLNVGRRKSEVPVHFGWHAVWPDDQLMAMPCAIECVLCITRAEGRVVLVPCGPSL